MRRVALLIAFFVGTGSAMYRAAPHPRRPLFSVVVATHELPMGTRIGSDDVTVLHVPRRMVPKDVTFSVAEEVVGRTTSERILASEVFRTERLAGSDAGTGLAAVITPGMRAMAIDVGGSVAGLAPGNFVDVIAEREGRADLVADFVRVLAVANEGRSVTLDVTLEDAEALASALSHRTLFLAERSEHDIVRSTPPGCQLGPLYVAPPRQGVRIKRD